MFVAGGIPMPIIVADGRNPDELVFGRNATVYEINPWEFGTLDPTAFAFAPLEYLGTRYSEGKLNPAGRCVKGSVNPRYILQHVIQPGPSANERIGRSHSKAS